jgi:ABC-type Zn2+ transport system substrate-binding protein/surface adhesin
MRRLLVLGCCALYLSFGSMAGLAHVHESADHHDGSRGIHLDHGHLSDSSDHEHENDHDRRHTDHHDGDAVYLEATAARSLDSSVRPMTEIVSLDAWVDPPSSTSNCDEAVTSQPRDPPRKFLPRLRAPPA